MFYLIVYDIPDDKRRLQIDKVLSAYGVRVNLSVFELILKNDTEYKKMVLTLKEMMKYADDSVRIYPLDKITVVKSEELGKRRQPFVLEAGYVF